MTTLMQALWIEPGDCIAVVGAGGKTSTCWRLVQDLARARPGQRVVFTTTTKIWRPADGVFDVIQIDPHPTLSPEQGGVWHTACLAAGFDGPLNFTPVEGAFMPTVHTKLDGFTPEDIGALHHRAGRAGLATTVVECDGARGLEIKAPGEHEPVIPACANVVCVLVSLDAIGQPLDDRVAHRAQRLSHLTNTPLRAPITTELIAALLTHPDGGLKGIPPGARAVAVLTQHATTAPHSAAPALMAQLVRSGFDRAVSVALRAAHPVLGVSTNR